MTLDFYSLLIAMASGAYIRTDNPKFGGRADEDGEYLGLTAPSYQKSLNIPGDGAISIPSNPGIPSSEDDRESSHLELTLGLNMSGSEGELRFLAPSSTYPRVNERGYNPRED